MRIVAILLALVPFLARPSTPPVAKARPEPIWTGLLPNPVRLEPRSREPVTCIMIGAQAIPLGGFEPAPTSTLSSLYDPEILPKPSEQPRPGQD